MHCENNDKSIGAINISTLSICMAHSNNSLLINFSEAFEVPHLLLKIETGMPKPTRHLHGQIDTDRNNLYTINFVS